MVERQGTTLCDVIFRDLISEICMEHVLCILYIKNIQNLLQILCHLALFKLVKVKQNQHAQKYIKPFS